MIHVGPSMSRGGAEVWLIDLVRFLDPSRVRVVRALVTSGAHVDPKVVGDLNGIPVEVGGADAVRRAAGECDILVCWGTPEFGTWLASSRPPVCVFIAHGEGSWTLTALKGCAPILDHVVAVSQGVHRRIDNGVPSSVIFNGVDSSRLACSRSREETRQMLGFAPGDFVLGVVGRFSEEKRVHVLINAVAALPPSYKILLVGWGPLRASLIDLANARIPGRYAFVKESHYLGDYYRAMDAACLLSREEGFALVTLEAMMCGRPLIVTPVGAVPEMIVDRVNGLVVSGTAESVAEAAERLRRHPAWARGMAEEARVFAEEHGHARLMARRYEDLFHRLYREKQARA
jgi:glycosyltransferase involved in cell wall biosynthesis